MLRPDCQPPEPWRGRAHPRGTTPRRWSAALPGRSPHDGALVATQDVPHGAEIVGMPHGRHDTDRGADESARHFRDLSRQST
jgi:hypothetical protein